MISTGFLASAEVLDNTTWNEITRLKANEQWKIPMIVHLYQESFSVCQIKIIEKSGANFTIVGKTLVENMYWYEALKLDTLYNLYAIYGTSKIKLANISFKEININVEVY